MLTHIHMVVYTWWCWHIYKEEEVGVDVDQLGEVEEVTGVTERRTKPWTCTSGLCGSEGCGLSLRPDIDKGMRSDALTLSPIAADVW